MYIRYLSVIELNKNIIMKYNKYNLRTICKFHKSITVYRLWAVRIGQFWILWLKENKSKIRQIENIQTELFWLILFFGLSLRLKIYFVRKLFWMIIVNAQYKAYKYVILYEHVYVKKVMPIKFLVEYNIVCFSKYLFN